MPNYSYTKSRVLQWLGIIAILCLFGGAYWYFQVRASTLNQSRNDLVSSGLVLLWSFNGDDITSGTTAVDRSATGANGTLTNGPTKVGGRIGQALDFDGTDDYVTTADNSALDVGTSTDVALSGWFSRESFTTDDTIIAKRSGITAGDTGYILYIDDATDQLIFEVSDGTDEYSLTSISTFTTAGWNHFVVVWDQDSAPGSELFINGVANTATDAGTIGNIDDLSNAVAFRVGAESDAGNPFDGKLDEIREYNRTLSTGEIQSLYDQGGGTRVNSSVSNAQGSGRLDSGLAGYWRLDDGSGTSATDSSSGGNTGTLNNGPTWGTGQIGGATSFDNTDDSITVGDVVEPEYITMSAWINRSGNGTVSIINKGTLLSSEQYSLFLDYASYGTVEMIVRAAGGGFDHCRTGSSGYTTGQWHLVTGTYNGTTCRVYVNGVDKTETVVSDTTSGVINTGASSLTIGSAFNGLLDEVRIYNRPLSPDEVAQLYRLTSPTSVDTSLKGYWSFNGQDMSGGYSFDRSGAGNTGSLYNSPTIARGILGQALDFDAVNDYVATADSSSLDIGDTDDLTLSGWFYRDTFTGTNGLIAKRSGFATGDVGYIAYIDATTDQLIFQISDGTDVYTITSSSTFTATDWHHFAVVWDQDSATNSEIYIDGTADKATDSGTIGNIGDLSNALGVYVGARSDGSTLFDGRIDEARVYKRALSATDIKSLYDQGSVDSVNSSASQNQGTGRLDSALALYWALDDGTSGTTPTSATDSSTNGNTGTLTNSPTWTTGQVGNAVDFDGTDDYITLADSDILDVTDSTNFTLSGWFNRDTFTTDDTITAKSNGQAASDTGYNVYIDDSTDKLTFVANDGTDQYKLESVSTFTATGWHHYALVWDESGATQTKLYIDGVAENVTATGTFTSVNSMANSVAFRVGSESDAGNPFDGKLDEVRLYRRAFSGDEVTNLYRLATPTATDTGLNGYWSFNGRDMNGTAVLDSSGAGNNGVLTNGPTRTIGKIGQGLSFDNTDDYVSVPDNASLDIGDTDNMTLAGWFYRNATGTADTIFAKRAGVLAANTGYIAYIALVGSKLIFEVSDGTDEYSLDSTSTFTTSANVGWNHFAIVWDQASAANSEIYINGVVDNATDTGTIGNIGDLSNAKIFSMGTQSDVSSPFNGKLDEMRMYKRALSAAEIAALYNQGR